MYGLVSHFLTFLSILHQAFYELSFSFLSDHVEDVTLCIEVNDHDVVPSFTTTQVETAAPRIPLSI